MLILTTVVILFNAPQGDVRELYIPLVLIVAMGLFVAGWYLSKSLRKRALNKLADELGFSVIEYQEERVPEELENVPMAEDFYYICKHKICGKYEGFHIAIFDLTVFEFEISKNFTYTAVTLTSESLNLPLFTLKPRMKLEENIAESRGVQFSDDFEFTRHFRVDALDTEDVRKIMTPGVRECIRHDHTMSIIAKLNTIFMHKYPGHMSIPQLKVCLEEIVNLAKEFQKAATKG